MFDMLDSEEPQIYIEQNFKGALIPQTIMANHATNWTNIQICNKVHMSKVKLMIVLFLQIYGTENSSTLFSNCVIPENIIKLVYIPTW